MRKIRVAEIIEATEGGTRRHLLDLVFHLDRNRFSVAVVCSANRDPAFRADIERMTGAGIPVTVIPMSREIRPWRDFRALVGVLRAVRGGGFDIVHTHSAKAGILGRIAGRLAGVPAVLHTSHVFPFLMDVGPARRRLYLQLERMAAGLADRIVCVYGGEKNLAVQRRVADAARIVVIENGVDAAEIERAAPPGAADAWRAARGVGREEIAVGMIGRLAPQKGCVYLVEAAADVLRRHPGVRFFIVGEGAQRREIERRAAGLGIGSRVEIAGETVDAYPCIAGLDVFVLPSLWEGLPYSLLEAMALRRAIVATRVGGVPEAVCDGESGIIVPPRDPAALARGILRFVEDGALRETMGRNARRVVESRFRRDAMLSRIGRLYEEVVAGRLRDY